MRVRREDEAFMGVAAAETTRITPLGEKLRKYKLDELPELPDMSTGEGMDKLKDEIERLQRGEYQQITINDLTENKGEE